MHYEIVQALSRKVDSWELHNLQNEVRKLNSENIELQKQIGGILSTVQSLNYCMGQLLQIIVEIEQLKPAPNREYDVDALKRYL